MKNKNLLVICLICTAICSLFYVNAKGYGIRDSDDPIDLQGRLAGSGDMRSQGAQVEAFKNATCVQLNFLVDLGSLEIEVVDGEGNPVFQTTVNATEGSRMKINTGSWATGKYTLVITDGLGGRLEGNFVIN